MDQITQFSPKHWLCIFAGLSNKNKKYLKRYFSTIYPRLYVRKLVAMLEEDNVQSKTAQHQWRE